MTIVHASDEPTLAVSLADRARRPSQTSRIPAVTSAINHHQDAAVCRTARRARPEQHALLLLVQRCVNVDFGHFPPPAKFNSILIAPNHGFSTLARGNKSRIMKFRRSTSKHIILVRVMQIQCAMLTPTRNLIAFISGCTEKTVRVLKLVWLHA
jgi:hypothetical protein